MPYSFGGVTSYIILYHDTSDIILYRNNSNFMDITCGKACRSHVLLFRMRLSLSSHHPWITICHVIYTRGASMDVMRCHR